MQKRRLEHQEVSVLQICQMRCIDDPWSNTLRRWVVCACACIHVLRMFMCLYACHCVVCVHTCTCILCVFVYTCTFMWRLFFCVHNLCHSHWLTCSMMHVHVCLLWVCVWLNARNVSVCMSLWILLYVFWVCPVHELGAVEPPLQQSIWNYQRRFFLMELCSAKRTENAKNMCFGDFWTIYKKIIRLRVALVFLTRFCKYVDTFESA